MFSTMLRFSFGIIAVLINVVACLHLKPQAGRKPVVSAAQDDTSAGHVALAIDLRRNGAVEQPICAICLDVLDKEGARKLAKVDGCAHEFHLQCITQWSMSGRDNADTCPSCRGALKGQFAKSSAEADLMMGVEIQEGNLRRIWAGVMTISLLITMFIISFACFVQPNPDFSSDLISGTQNFSGPPSANQLIFAPRVGRFGQLDSLYLTNPQLRAAATKAFAEPGVPFVTPFGDEFFPYSDFLYSIGTSDSAFDCDVVHTFNNRLRPSAQVHFENCNGSDADRPEPLPAPSKSFETCTITPVLMRTDGASPWLVPWTRIASDSIAFRGAHSMFFSFDDDDGGNRVNTKPYWKRASNDFRDLFKPLPRPKGVYRDDKIWQQLWTVTPAGGERLRRSMARFRDYDFSNGLLLEDKDFPRRWKSAVSSHRAVIFAVILSLDLVSWVPFLSLLAAVPKLSRAF